MTLSPAGRHRPVQQQLAIKERREVPITTLNRTRHPYQLRGLMFCGLCQRRM